MELISRITNLNLEDAKAIHPGDEATERCFTSARDSDQQQMSLWLSEDPVDTQHVV